MRLLAAALSAALLILSGCASYQLGNPTELPYQSVRVATPLNQTDLPQIEAPLAAALRTEILNSSLLKLATASKEDARLELTIVESKREIAAVQSQDVGRGRKFELKVIVSLSLRNPAQPDSYFIRDRQFEISQDIFTDSGQVDAEYQATPELARLIAIKSAEILQDLW